MKHRASALLSLVLLLCAFGPLRAQELFDREQELAALYKQIRKTQEKSPADAVPLLTQYLDRATFPATRQTWEYADIHVRMAAIASAQGNYAVAVNWGEKAVALFRLGVSEGWKRLDRSDLAAALLNLSAYYSQKGDFDRAVILADESVQLYREVDVRKVYLPKALAQLASGYLARGDADDIGKAQALCVEALKDLKSGTADYANTLNNLSICYTHAGQTDKADKALAEADKVWRKKFGANSAEYAKVLNNRATVLSRARQYEQALAVEESALSMLEGLQLDSSYVYAKMLYNYAKFQELSDNYDGCVQTYLRALPIIERTVGRQHDYYRGTNELSAAYFYQGNLEESERWAMASAGYDASATVNKAYIRSRSALARSFFANANYAAAIKIETTTLGIYRSMGDSVNMAVSLDYLAMCHYYADSLARAVDLALKAVHIFERNAPDHLSYAQTLNNLSTYFYALGRTAEATEAGARALALYEARGQTGGAVYAKMLGNMALYFAAGDSLARAVDYAERAYALHCKVLGETHPDNALMCYNLAQYYKMAGDSLSMQHYFHRALRLQNDVVRSNFSHLTTAEREQYWSRKNYVFKAVPILLYGMQTSDTLAIDAYNAQLFTKGLLLNSEVDFRKLLLSTGSLGLLEKYNRIEALNEERSAVADLAPAERDARLAAIADETAALEKDLVRGCKEYGDFTDNLSIGVDRVADALGEGDVAVELMDVEVEGMGTTWVALVLRRGWKVPRFVRLFSRYELDKLRFDGLSFFEAIAAGSGPDYTNHVYDSDTLGRMVWQPLAEAWGEGVRDVYFAPAGVFYSFAAEYLPLDRSGRRACDVYDIHRLSSTKLLAQKRDPVSFGTAFIYGGLDYDMDEAALLANHRRYEMQRDLLAMRSLDDEAECARFSAASRKVSFLIGTEEESDSIAACLSGSGIRTQLYQGRDGTEETFKLLTCNDGGILHIATHGFSYTEAEAKRRSMMGLLSETGESDGLNLSGLLLSGANLALSGTKVPKGVENGVLTASEIALLDMNWANLVVLSACQTGLGEVRADGVFGLQRGFKKAGARTLVMSLWSVSDEATCAMMTEFYTRLAAGIPCRRAFREAQDALRLSSAFGRPFYWASFVMLDGE